jgi:hypothetical protein
MQFVPFPKRSKVFNLFSSLFLFIGLLISLSLHAQTKPIHVGVARIDITPDRPIRLTGYASRTTVSEGVAQKLWAKAIAIGTDREGPSLLITVDLLGIPAFITNELAQKLAAQSAVRRPHLAVCATHTHNGPALGGVATNILSDLTAEQMADIAAYTAGLKEKLLKVALEALAGRRPAYLSWGRGKVGFATNRRVLRDGKYVFGENFEGPVDHDLPVMRITGGGGEIRAVWINYACHCTTFGATNQIHGDWAGTACEMIEKDYPGALALVSIGCGGDANPSPRGEMEHVLQHGSAVHQEVKRLLAGSMTPIRETPKAEYEEVELFFAHIPTWEELLERGRESNWEDRYAKKHLEILTNGGEIPASISYPIQSWTFGNDLAVVFLGGEVVVDYALKLKKELDRSRLWINAYANDVPCYIPSRRILREGGYEAERSMYYYNKPSPFRPEVEDLIVTKVLDLVGGRFR